SSRSSSEYEKAKLSTLSKKNSLLSSTTSIILNPFSPLLSLNAIHTRTAMIVGKISGVIKVASKKDLFFTLAKYSLLITRRILSMVTIFYFLDKYFFNGRTVLFESQYLTITHQMAQHHIWRHPVKWNGKRHMIGEGFKIHPFHGNFLV